MSERTDDGAPVTLPGPQAQGRNLPKPSAAPVAVIPPLTVEWFLWDELRTYHVGYAKGAKRFYLLGRVRDRMRKPTASDVSDSELRIAKERLIEVFGVLVGSDLKGWWLCENWQEADSAAKFLEDKGRDLMHKGKLLRTRAEEQFGPQMDLFNKTKEATP